VVERRGGDVERGPDVAADVICRVGSSDFVLGSHGGDGTRCWSARVQGRERDQPSSRTSITAILPLCVPASRIWERAIAVRRSGITDAGAIKVDEAMLKRRWSFGVLEFRKEIDIALHEDSHSPIYIEYRSV